MTTAKKTATAIGILEDHPMMREALAYNVVLHLPDAEIFYKGQSIEELLEEWQKIDSQENTRAVVILDLDLGDGSEPLDNLNRLLHANLSIVVVSALASARTVRLMLRNGAAAYVSKSSDAEALRDAIVGATNNQQYMSPDIAIALLGEDEVHVALSQKERQALSLYASGMKLDAVASSMDISRSTASEYIQRARKKYTKAGIHLTNKTDLYRQAQKDGLLK